MSSTDDILQRIEQANQNWAASLPSGSGQVHSPFDPLDHARLSPSALDPNSFSNNFILPRFASGGPSGGPLGEYGVAIVEPERPRDTFMPYKNYGTSSTLAPGPWKSPSPYPGQPFPSPAPAQQQSQPAAQSSTSAAQHPSIYAPYGSSVVSVDTTNYPLYKMPSIPMPPAGPPSEPFNPASLGLPVPPAPGTSTNFAGLYSSSGFDMLSVLARVAARPNQTIQIGPVDTSCAFLVADARRYDQPIVYASETFCRMTGYTSSEIIGKNCRFLQSPDGNQSQGQPRKWTDGQAAWHIRQHISQGKESQSSLINYKKGGRPFINLVTIVPIQWDSDEIAYYVGFQVDLVEQPNAILDRMKDGTYVVNYSLLNTNNMATKSITMRSIETETSNESEETSGSGLVSMSAIEEKPFAHSRTSKSVSEDDNTPAPTTHMTPNEILDAVIKKGPMPFDTEEDNREWHKLIFANTTDFVHVLSLKGSFLYCSPSSARVLEYEPYELVGQTLPTLCHPSDVVPVMRELKEAGGVPHSKVSLLYRVRRKHSGYMWMAAEGKLHIEPGKGRKSVILIGRPFSALKMSWKELRQAGGLGDQEFWAKCSPDGKILAATAGVATLLGISQADIVGESLDHLLKPDHAVAFKQALRAAEAGTFMTLSHKMRGRKAWMDIVSHFYPPRAQNHDGIGSKDSGPHRHIPIIVQMTDSLSEGRKKRSPFGIEVPAYHGAGIGSMSPRSSDSTSSSSTSFFKSLEHPSAVSDNAFDELDTTRCTSWQYELHQLQNSTKRLREEKELLLQQWRKRRLDYGAAAPKSRGSQNSEGGSSSSSRLGRICGNCGRTDSPEWRAGPLGPRTLCNACGLRWAKANGSAKNSPSTASAMSPSSLMSP